MQGDFALLGVPKNNFSLPLAQDLLAAVQVWEWNGYKGRHFILVGPCVTLFLCLRCQPQNVFVAAFGIGRTALGRDRHRG
jgi:hypothetical protein